MSSITIIDYGMGNLGSIQNMLKKIGVVSVITSDPEIIKESEKLILPGVGSFDQAMFNLNQLGLITIIQNKAASGTPILGICLGMQLLANSSEEGELQGLGLVPGKVIKFHLPATYKIPHMGWNLVDCKSLHPLYEGFEILEEVRFYFVHSYHFVCVDEHDVSGTTNYGSNFISSVQKGNVYGVQFHPEKSHQFGQLLLKNFAAV
jgi:glutamine amidotransferase